MHPTSGDILFGVVVTLLSVTSGDTNIQKTMAMH